MRSASQRHTVLHRLRRPAAPGGCPGRARRPAPGRPAPARRPGRAPARWPASSAPPIPPDGDVLQGGPGNPPRSWRGRRFPVWLPFAAALVLVLGGLAAWYLTGPGSAKPLAAHPAAPGQHSPGGGSAQAATARPTTGQPTTGQPITVQPTPTGVPGPSGSPPPSGSVPATPAAGGTVVTLGPGVSGQAAAAPVAAFLGQYFTAVNEHDYQAFISLFTPAAQQSLSPQGFSSGSGTTRDSAENLVALSPAQHGKTAATITFVSHQAPAESATGTACTVWRITLYLRPSGSSYLIGKAPAPYHASARACP